MRYLIDGNNLLHTAPTYLPGPAIGRQRLCTLLAYWAERTGLHATVVFDGARPPPGLEAQMQTRRVRIEFSAPRSADLLIEELIEQAEQPSQMCVVTGDRAIQSVARRRRCVCVSSAAFARELAAPAPPPPRPEPAPDAPEKPDGLRRDETDAWLRQFNFDPDEPPDENEWLR